jgi:hypothetical protein
LVDLDGDGHIDLLSGSWPGELDIFRGGPNHSFGPRKLIKDKQGKVINTGPASAVHAADWDGDGDLDLLVGDIDGKVHLVPNEGTARSYSFAKERLIQADGKDLRVAGDAGPFVVDWDGDGNLDLLVGAGDGSVSLYRNVGSARAPKLASAATLVAPGDAGSGGGAPSVLRRGIRSKVCAADWNGDGRLDLLVGDFTMQAPMRSEASPGQKAREKARRKELESVRKDYFEQIDKVSQARRSKSKEDLDKANKALAELQDKMQKLQSQVPRAREYHGWVWLFLRKPVAEKAAAR